MLPFFLTVAPELLIPGLFPPGTLPPGPVKLPSMIKPPLFDPVLLPYWPVPPFDEFKTPLLDSPDSSYCVVCNFGFELPPIDDLPAILKRKNVNQLEDHLPYAVVEGSGVSSHDFGAIRSVFVKNLV